MNNRTVRPNQKLWRYMDFVKFFAMLEKEGLFFPRVTKFQDRHEGWPTIPYRKKLNDAYYAFSDDKRNIKNFWFANRKIIERMRKKTLINCWHMSADESANMWAMYGGEDKSICLQTTCGKLKSQFPAGIVIEPVRYINYDTVLNVPIRHQQDYFLYKRRSFAHERELRVILMDDPAVKKCLPFRVNADGTWVNCNLRGLIEKIYISPKAEAWFADLIRTLTKRKLPNVAVIQSSLYAEPKMF